MLTYFQKKYLLTYLWLASVVIYVARSLFGYGSAITVLAQLFVDITGVYSLCYLLAKLPKCNLRRALISIFVLLAIMFLYYIIYPKHVRGGAWLEDGGSALGQIKLVMFSFSGFTSTAYLTIKKKLDINILRVFFVVFLIISIVLFFTRREYISELYGSSIIVNNTGYIILSLFALSFIFGKKLRILYLIVAIIMAGMSAKRGAALQSVMFSVIVFLLSVRGENNKQKISWTILAIISVTIMVHYFSDSFDAIINRLDRDGTQSAARENIFSSIFTSFFDGNPFFMLFGYGSLSTVRFAGNYAHNDFVEILSNFGFLGLYLLLTFYYSLYRHYRICRKQQNILSNILLVSILLCFYKSILSMNLYSDIGCIVMLSAAFAMTYSKTNKSECDNASCSLITQ